MKKKKKGAVRECRIPDFLQNTTNCYYLIICNSTFHQLHAKSKGGWGSTRVAHTENIRFFSIRAHWRYALPYKKIVCFLKHQTQRKRTQDWGTLLLKVQNMEMNTNAMGGRKRIPRTANLSLQVVSSAALCTLSIILHENLVHWTIQVFRYLKRWKMSQNVT